MDLVFFVFSVVYFFCVPRDFKFIKYVSFIVLLVLWIDPKIGFKTDSFVGYHIWVLSLTMLTVSVWQRDFIMKKELH